MMDLDVAFPELAHRTNTELIKEITLDGLKKLLGIEIAEEYLERAVLEKIDGYEIPAQWVDLYAAGRINLLNALKYLLVAKNGAVAGQHILNGCVFGAMTAWMAMMMLGRVHAWPIILIGIFCFVGSFFGGRSVIEYIFKLDDYI